MTRLVQTPATSAKNLEKPKAITPLEKARKARGLSQRQIAELSGVDQSRLSLGERGYPMSRAQAEKLAKFFGHVVSEMQLIYPERYSDTPSETSPISQAS